MASITFDDGTGSTTVQSSWPAPANRFRSWTPDARPFGEAAHALGDGARYQWRFRVDYLATFEIPGIINTDLGDVLRLMAWLRGGGSCQIITGDASSNTYTECGLAPDTDPTLTMSEREGRIEYTLGLTLLNIAASPAALLCEYGA